MKSVGIGLGVVLASATWCLADPLPMDTPVPINGVEAVCTGIGSGKDDPRWAEYPVRVEFSNGAAQYLAGVHLELASGHGSIASLDCDGSWVLFRLPRGSYKVTAELTGQPAAGPHMAAFTTTGSPPQKRVEVQFPRVAANQ